jgi:hypothetical protein
MSVSLNNIKFKRLGVYIVCAILCRAISLQMGINCILTNFLYNEQFVASELFDGALFLFHVTTNDLMPFEIDLNDRLLFYTPIK